MDKDAHYSDVIMSAMVSQLTGVSSVCSTVCSGADQRKTSKLCVTGLWGESVGHRWFPSQKASNATWWRHQMETFSALQAICAGNSPVPGEFPTQRPVTRSFDVYFDLRPNKRLRKQSWGWWFETLSPPLWRHRNENISIWWVMTSSYISWITWTVLEQLITVWNNDKFHNLIREQWRILIWSFRLAADYWYNAMIIPNKDIFCLFCCTLFHYFV